MKNYIEIIDVSARQILDSRSNPTVEVDVILEDGTIGRAAVTIRSIYRNFEAVELRDGDKSVYNGKGVLKAIENVNDNNRRRISWNECFRQIAIDKAMIELDGTDNKGKLGANAMLGVSLVCKEQQLNI